MELKRRLTIASRFALVAATITAAYWGIWTLINGLPIPWTTPITQNVFNVQLGILYPSMSHLWDILGFAMFFFVLVLLILNIKTALNRNAPTGLYFIPLAMMLCSMIFIMFAGIGALGGLAVSLIGFLGIIKLFVLLVGALFLLYWVLKGILLILIGIGKVLKFVLSPRTWKRLWRWLIAIPPG